MYHFLKILEAGSISLEDGGVSMTTEGPMQMKWKSKFKDENIWQKKALNVPGLKALSLRN